MTLHPLTVTSLIHLLVFMFNAAFPVPPNLVANLIRKHALPPYVGGPVLCCGSCHERHGKFVIRIINEGQAKNLSPIVDAVGRD